MSTLTTHLDSRLRDHVAASNQPRSCLHSFDDDHLKSSSDLGDSTEAVYEIVKER